MTPTQLQEMSDRDLVEYARGMRLVPQQRIDNYIERSQEVLDELANRLDDRYPFNPEPTPETET